MNWTLFGDLIMGLIWFVSFIIHGATEVRWRWELTDIGRSIYERNDLGWRIAFYVTTLYFIVKVFG